jgi:drug/metabolite transporter (DMT)-like permease
MSVREWRRQPAPPEWVSCARYFLESPTLSSHSARTTALLLLFIALKAFGNLSLAWGTKQFSQQLSANPVVYLAALLNPFVMAGVFMMVLSILTRLALLSVADLSFVLPLTAVGYVFSALLGVTFLGENVTPTAWMGTLLIFVGAAIVSSTPRMRLTEAKARNEMAAAEHHGQHDSGERSAES